LGNIMSKTTIVLALQLALGASFLCGSTSAVALDDAAVGEIRAQIKEMRESYEARLKALEQRLQEVQGKNKQLEATIAAKVPTTPVVPVLTPEAKPFSTNQSNPAISLILNGFYTDLTQDPDRYRLQGFIPGGAERFGLQKRGFSLGETELTVSGAIDPFFAGQLTFILDGEGEAGVEEAFIRTTDLAKGLNVKAGRFFSGFGYQNGQHAHVWDFSDLPVAYQALLGGQTATDGLQVKWLAPTDRFFEVGLELGAGNSFPGAPGNKNGIGTSVLFAHVGDDIGKNGSYLAGLSFVRNMARDRVYEDDDGIGNPVTNSFNGRSETIIADSVIKWAFSGQRSFKLQGEYFYRTERGRLGFDLLNADAPGPEGGYRSSQGGFYLQGIYQFHPEWRTGIRYDRLRPGSQRIDSVNDGRLQAANFPILSEHRANRTGIMLEWNRSEFSRIRLQLGRDRPSPGVVDNQILLQYTVNLGAHGAHSF
jgi:hypothetical protein